MRRRADGRAAPRLGGDRSGRHTLIAAPTGSGKTLAAFLTAIDELVRDGARGAAAGRSPRRLRLAAEGAERRHPQEPGRAAARHPRSSPRRSGIDVPRITAAVRTGDTTQSERAAMLRTPPHILVTTPESLYLLLTAERSRQMLRTVRTVIVDEIHAVIGTRRGAHLALSLERLEAVCADGGRISPIGCSASAFRPRRSRSTRSRGSWSATTPLATTASSSTGHRRTMDLAVEIPGSPLEAVMAHEVWEEYYERLAALIAEHKTTLVFVNTRRLAERVARHLSERLGDDAVTAHHGSLSKERRLDAEHRLKTGVAQGARRDGIARARHRHRPRRSRLPDRIAASHRHAAAARRPVRALDRRHAQGAAAAGVAGRPGRVRGAASCRPGAASSTPSCRTMRRSTCWRSRSPRRRRATDTARTSSSRSPGAHGRIERCRAPISMPSWRWSSDGFATPRGRRAALVHRDEVNRRSAAGADRACWR